MRKNNQFFDNLNINLNRFDLYLITPKSEVISTKQYVLVTDGNYKAFVKAENYLRNDKKKTPLWFSVKNPYIIENINQYYSINYNGNFKCISAFSEIKDRYTKLKFVCTRCGKEINKSIFNAIRHDDSHHGIQCSNCDEHFESIHAIVLKQIYKHFYPDSIEEDPSCINPHTGYIMATDIVNHRLKIAIEIQGQWHRFEKQKERDKIKKQYWLNRGYKFYDYEIENVSVLQYIQYFFPDIKEIPSWVNMDYNKKINLVKAQELLNSGLKTNQVAEKLNINVSRLYDALHCNKLYYPKNYSKSNRKPVVQLDKNMNLINTYSCYRDAERDNNIYTGLMASCISAKSYYCQGYYWVPKKLYDSGQYKITKRRTDKFYQKVVKLDMNCNELNRFDNMYEAAKDIGTIAFKIYEVTIGKRKSIKHFKYILA